jgi:hypothetical protein
VRKIKGMAHAAFFGNDERHEIATVTGVCLALYSMPEGRLVATAETSASGPNSGVFNFSGVAAGRYRLISMLPPKSPFVPIDAPIKVVRWPRGGVFSDAKIYLHFRTLRLGALSYASTTSKRPNIVDTRSHSARHNNGMHPTANSDTFIRETPCLIR